MNNRADRTKNGPIIKRVILNVEPSYNKTDVKNRGIRHKIRNMIHFIIYLNFGVYLAAFGAALSRNFSFNIALVGLIYLVPLIPFGIPPDSPERFLIVSLSNTIFGIIELAVFVVTVRPGDAPFDREHVKQLIGHVLPIGAALIGMSCWSRQTSIPVTAPEFLLIAAIFVIGSVLRVLAIYQLGTAAFKFDIVFREKQTLKTDQLYRWMRHPSYTAMMIVALAYAITTHSWGVSALGLLSAWFGFQYRIHYEENALRDQFGESYLTYRNKTGMWIPFCLRGGE